MMEKKIMTEEEFLEFYGIPMPTNGAEREMLILGNLAGLKDTPPQGIEELEEWADNLTQYMLDTRHIPYNQLN